MEKKQAIDVSNDKHSHGQFTYELGSVGPPRIWGLDPFYKCGVKLFISEVLNIPQLQGFSRQLIFYFITDNLT